MKKLYAPLGKNREHWITQTNHGAVVNNPSNFDNHVAIDLSATADTDVFACADGICSATIGTGSARYFILSIDNSPIQALYVHAKSNFTKSIHVKKGQVVGKVIPYIYYVKGIKARADHLHFGLQNKDRKTPHPMPMEYLDRTIKFRTRYPSIDKLWFKNGKINWAIFRDLSYIAGLPLKYRRFDRVKLGRAWNLYYGSGAKAGRASNGAVGEIISDKLGQLPNSLGDKDWYNIRFLDRTAYIADNRYLSRVGDEITRMDGTRPNPCSVNLEDVKKLEGIIDGQNEVIDRMVRDIDALNNQIKKMTEENKKLQMALEKYGDDKARWEQNKSELELKIKDLNDQLKSKKAEVIANLSVGETLGLALQKVWNKFFNTTD